jgi:hypothetical protein
VSLVKTEPLHLLLALAFNQIKRMVLGVKSRQNDLPRTGKAGRFFSLNGPTLGLRRKRSFN